MTARKLTLAERAIEAIEQVRFILYGVENPEGNPEGNMALSPDKVWEVEFLDMIDEELRRFGFGPEGEDL